MRIFFKHFCLVFPEKFFGLSPVSFAFVYKPTIDNCTATGNKFIVYYGIWFILSTRLFYDEDETDDDLNFYNQDEADDLFATDHEFSCESEDEEQVGTK